jgi:UDP-N-acetylglucosamine--N-acetylmuramyl-(pentapeptide) pyrophosphoryl-undecaprenol N-acetylglucosamine transferase
VIRPAGIPRVLLAGGGTGGHLFPGVAVAERLVRRMPGARMELAATAKDRASPHIAACPLELVDLESPKLPLGAADVAGFGVRMGRALLRSYAYLRENQTDLVLGLGGYGSVAPVMAARARRIPAIVLEQNAVPGKATRLLGRLGAVAAASFPGIERHGFRGRVHVTGNPLRERVLAARRAHADFGLDPSLPVLGVLGGSLGSRALSARVVAGLPALRAATRREFQVLHATGSPEEAARHADAYRVAGISACVRPFFADMGAFYGTVDVVLCRAGGTTVAEVAALGVPAVFVPYPHHGDDHQRSNAEPLVLCGAASLVAEEDLTPAALAREVAPVLADATHRARRSQAARSLGRPDAADRVVDLVLELTGHEDDRSSRSCVAAARPAEEEVSS